MVQLQRMEEQCVGEEGGGGLSEEQEEELECKICYCPYSLSGRRPKLLPCRHRLCSLCLAALLAPGSLATATTAAAAVVCPFCRRPVFSSPPHTSLPDDHGLLAVLGRTLRSHNPLGDSGSTELLLTPSTLGAMLGAGNSSFSFSSSSFSSSYFPPPAPRSYASIRSSPNFMVITIMEPPPQTPPLAPSGLALRSPPHGLRHPRCPGGGGSVAPIPPPQAALMYRSSSSLDSAAAVASWRRCSVRTCAALLLRGAGRALVWLLGLLYLCSLPLGVYLLTKQKTTVGALLVSLVPASVTGVIVYGFCQCLCQELWDCIPP